MQNRQRRFINKKQLNLHDIPCLTMILGYFYIFFIFPKIPIALYPIYFTFAENIKVSSTNSPFKVKFCKKNLEPILNLTE